MRVSCPFLLVTVMLSLQLARPIGAVVTAQGGAAAPSPMPVISRNAPVFASAQGYPAARANDSDYATYWRSDAVPAWIAYDLSAVPPAHRARVVVVWYGGTQSYDHTVFNGGPGYNLPKDYTLEGNAAAGGGAAPSSGWVTLVSVTGNTYHSRQHVLDFSGYNWLRLNVTASDGSPLNDDVALNMDVHDVSLGVEDDWIFYGDSITASAMDLSPRGVGTFAQLIHASDPPYFPAAEDGGIPFLASYDAVKFIPTWLGIFPGHFVGLSYGSNDANGCTSVDGFYNNYVTMVQAVLDAGKIPVVPTIPWAPTANVQTCGPAFNAKIEALYAAYPQIVRGPDLWTFFSTHRELFSGGDLHPTDEGDAAYRQSWANAMLAAVYYAPTAERYFPQTGYRIESDAFWDYFTHRGGVATFGYPVSRTFTLMGFPTQLFQRQAMQQFPDGSVHLLNLLDPGLMPYRTFNFSTFPAPDPAVTGRAPPVGSPGYAAAVLAFVRQQAPDTWQGLPVGFGQTFNHTVSAQSTASSAVSPALLPALDLEIWGVPTSPPAYDPNNHGVVYLRWQRGVMQYDASCSCTRGILLADYFKAILTGQNLPSDLGQEATGSPFLDQYDPNAANWVHNPAALPGTDLTAAFIPG